MNDSNKLVLTAIIGIFVGLVLGRLLWYSKTSLPNDTASYGEEATTTEGINYEETSEPTTDAGNLVESTATVSVMNQPAGKTAEVLVSATQIVWVEVRDNNNGVMGKVLGAKQFSAGSNMKVVVPLLRATEAGKSYFVALVPYTGETLNYSASVVMKDKSGKSVASTFTAQ